MIFNTVYKKITKKYPINDLIYITHDCCVYKSKQTDNNNISIIKITPYLHKQHCILKSVSHINSPHLLTPILVDKYKNYTVSVYPFKTTVIDKIITDKLCFSEIFALALNLCDGINQLHSNNILHLDISPNNIYINDDGTFCIGDFSSSQKKHNNNIRRNIYFTEGYSPPEFKTYSKKTASINELSDEYSLGKTLLSLCNRHVETDPECHTMNNPDIPEQFLNILNKASSEIQEYRYPTISDFKSELLAFKTEYNISEIKYHISFNSENNPFNKLKTQPVIKRHIETPAPIAQNIINSPAFMTTIILLSIILPILAIYKVFYTSQEINKITARNMQYISASVYCESKEPYSTPKAKKGNLKIKESNSKKTDVNKSSVDETNTKEIDIDKNDSSDTDTKKIDIDKNDSSDTGTKEVDIKNKKITSLSANNIKKIYGADFDISSINIISANNNTISDISGLSEFISVSELYLSCNQIKNITSLNKLSSLKTLVISSNLIDDISVLKTLKSLENLDLSSNKKLKDITALYELKNLKLLCINETSVTKSSIKQLKEKLPNCEIIN